MNAGVIACRRRTVSGGPPPTVTNGTLVLDLNASTAASVGQGNAIGATWADQSGAGNHLTLVTQPTYNLNGTKHEVSFQPNQGGATPLSLAVHYAIFTVERYVSNSGARRTISSRTRNALICGSRSDGYAVYNEAPISGYNDAAPATVCHCLRTGATYYIYSVNKINRTTTNSANATFGTVGIGYGPPQNEPIYSFIRRVLAYSLSAAMSTVDHDAVVDYLTANHIT